MIDSAIHSKAFKFQGAKSMLYLGDKILVIRRDNKTENYPLCIDLPGGGIEESETPFEALQREVKEELGLELTINDVTFAKIYPSTFKPGKKSLFFVARIDRYTLADVVFGDEGLEFFLIDPFDFIKRLDGVPGQQKRVSEYLEFINKTNSALSVDSFSGRG